MLAGMTLCSLGMTLRFLGMTLRFLALLAFRLVEIVEAWRRRRFQGEALR